MQSETIQALEENMGESLFNLDVVRGLLTRTPNPDMIKQMIFKSHCITIIF